MPDQRTTKYDRFFAKMREMKPGDGPLYFEDDSPDLDRLNQRLRMAVSRREGLEPRKNYRWVFTTYSEGVAVSLVRE